MTDDIYYYVVSEYYATGEGMTKAMLITRAYSHVNDLDDNHEPKYSGEEKALREFERTFNNFICQGSEIISKKDFLFRFEDFIPVFVKKIIKNELKTPGNFSWFSEVHFNYS
jgi:hypothetical protein